MHSYNSLSYKNRHKISEFPLQTSFSEILKVIIGLNNSFTSLNAEIFIFLHGRKGII
jgi:hypothetical protein